MTELLLEKALFSEWLPLTLAAGELWDDKSMAKLEPAAGYPMCIVTAVVERTFCLLPRLPAVQNGIIAVQQGDAKPWHVPRN